MRKELKYLLYISTIFVFFIFVGNYYFSDENIKKSYRSTKLYDNKIIEYSNNLQILKSDTEDIIDYVDRLQFHPLKIFFLSSKKVFLSNL